MCIDNRPKICDGARAMIAVAFSLLLFTYVRLFSLCESSTGTYSKDAICSSLALLFSSV